MEYSAVHSSEIIEDYETFRGAAPQPGLELEQLSDARLQAEKEVLFSWSFPLRNAITRLLLTGMVAGAGWVVYQAYMFA